MLRHAKQDLARSHWPQQRQSSDPAAAAARPSPRRSKKFPYCDGAHAAHNAATGDNVGPLIIKAPALGRRSRRPYPDVRHTRNAIASLGSRGPI